MGRTAKKKHSVFDHRSISQIYDEITTLYLEDKRPWVIGFSGGKDSSCTLQLIWNAIAKLPPQKRNKTIYVVSSDTLVEIPIVASRIISTHENIVRAAKKKLLPFIPALVTPMVSDSFWVNLLGKGYPAPSQMFRWCTERLKIDPVSAFILDKIAEYGEATIVLGARKGESASRDQVLKKAKDQRTLSHESLPSHPTLPSAFIYTPIDEFTADDVWQYLLQVPNPWGDDNHDLLAMYRSANAGECPLVIDKSTPSCGNSRFGCWVCTLVQRDRAMEALVDEEEWLAPLLDFRNLLSKTQDPKVKHRYRDYKRRTGQVSYKIDGGLVRGPYRLSFRQELLNQLLSIQRDLPEDHRIELISVPELREIRRIWRIEEQDWEDSVPGIYRQVYGHDIEWEKDDVIDLGALEMQALAEVANEHQISESLMRKLLDVERLHHGMSKRPRVFADIDSVLSQEWRTEKEILFQIASAKESK